MLAAIVALILNPMPPALVTAPPVIIDATNYSCQFGVQINPFGIFQVAANKWYQVLNYSAPGPKAIAVYLSTDQGATWNEQDAANHVALTSNVSGQSVFFNPTTGIISILYQQVSGPNFVFNAIRFNTGTNTYAAPVGTSAGANNAQGVIYEQSTGQIVVVSNVNIPPNDLSFLTINAGVWAGPTSFGVVNDNPVALGVDVDSADSGHLEYEDGITGALSYAQISAVLALSAPITISPTWDNQIIDHRLWNGNIVIAWTEVAGLNGAASTALYVAIAPISATPVFTTYKVYDITGVAENFLFSPELSIDNAGNLVAFVTQNKNVHPAVNPVDKLLKFAFSGTAWSGPVLFYDAVSNPPPGDIGALNQLILTGASVQLANGAWVYLTQMETRGPSGSSEVPTGFTLMSPGSAPPQNNPGPAGRRPLILTPNQFDFCLHRENRLYCAIDIARLTCANIPACFSVDEREWGAAS